MRLVSISLFRVNFKCTNVINIKFRLHRKPQQKRLSEFSIVLVSLEEDSVYLQVMADTLRFPVCGFSYQRKSLTILPQMYCV